MINLSFSILNPYTKDFFKTIYNRSGKITKNKSWEVEIHKQDYTLFDFNIDTCIVGKDHAGINVLLGLFSYVICAKIHDTRHWDYTKNCWEEHENRD